MEETQTGSTHQGKLVGALQLSSVLGSVTGLQSVLGASGVWHGPGDHAHWSPHLLHWSAVEEQTTLDFQYSGESHLSGAEVVLCGLPSG